MFDLVHISGGSLERTCQNAVGGILVDSPVFVAMYFGLKNPVRNV